MHGVKREGGLASVGAFQDPAKGEMHIGGSSSSLAGAYRFGSGTRHGRRCGRKQCRNDVRRYDPTITVV